MDDRAVQPPPWMRAEARRVYGQDPEGYEAGRPEYPERIYEVLTERCGLGPGTAVLEIGPGTGRVTRRLVALGARVVAVEPDAALAAHLTVSVGPVVETIVAPFEEAALPHEFDLVVAAMSFHWVDQDVGLPKLGQVIRPGRWVALWWTVFGDRDRPDPFAEATDALLVDGNGPRDQPDVPPFELDIGERRRELAERAGLVSIEAERIPWTARMDTAQLRALYASMIAIRGRAPSEQQRLLDILEAIATEQFGGVVERPFITALYTGRRP